MEIPFHRNPIPAGTPEKGFYENLNGFPQNGGNTEAIDVASFHYHIVSESYIYKYIYNIVLYKA